MSRFYKDDKAVLLDVFEKIRYQVSICWKRMLPMQLARNTYL